MKNIMIFTTILTIALIGVSCSAASANSSNPPDLPQANIVTNHDSTDVQEVESDVVGENLTTAGNGLPTAEEINGLIFMREEEKLAFDLYLSFYEKWGLPIFQNIAASEQTHMDSVAFLLDQYGIPDPTTNLTMGVFTDPVLQDLYDQLLASGSLSIGNALKAGAAVEEVDILDLRERSAKTQLADILRVYQNLESGSYNHLGAFVSVLENQIGEVYSPIYLTLEDFQQIISGGMQTNGQGPGGNNGRGGPRTN
jgi:hypothetical protein